MDSLHCIPVDDLIEHEANEGCLCGPSVMPVEQDGAIGWILLHHSLDGREFSEVAASPSQ